MRIVSILVLPVLLLGCGGDADSAAAPTPTVGTDVDDDDGDDDLQGEPSGQALLVLYSDGLDASADGAPVDELTFSESDRATATAAVEAALGAPTASEAALDCGPGPLDSASWQGLDLYFSDGTFAGWYLQDPAPAVATTADGVGLGITRGELETLLDGVIVEETSIGTEWYAGDLSGTLTGDGDDATVDVMWAGATCIAR
jgi:hypothetical protein